ncbi:MAG: hypothetical protein ACRD4S_15565 [Candidatus Acidiferrales bacterium]
MRMASLFAFSLLVGAAAQVFAPSATSFAIAQPNTQSPAKALPHDRHAGMDVSADPYTGQARAKEKFGKANPLPVGILPVEVFLHNETARAIKINLDTIQLEVRLPSGEHQNLDWLAPEVVARLIAHPGGTPNPSRPRLPIGLGISGDKKAQKFADTLRPLALDGDIVPPMSVIHGFLFFNLSHDMALVSTSSLYIPDAAVLPENKPLIFFEIPLSTPSQP